MTKTTLFINFRIICLQNLRLSMEKVSAFLGKKYTSSQYETLAEHLKIDNFKKNPSLNVKYLRDLKVLSDDVFVRAGKTGGWRDYFDDDLNARADKWIQENIKDTDIQFPEGFFK